MRDQTQYITINDKQYPLCPLEDIPTDDPNLPSYKSFSYDGCEEDLDLIESIYTRKVQKYLNRWTAETKEDHKNRVDRTLFQNYFATAVKGFPGFLSDIRDIDKLYPGLVDSKKNVDRQGNGLETFLWQADLLAIRDGYCGILVDCPKSPTDEEGEKLKVTLADRELVSSLRPYLVLIERKNIISWRKCSDGDGTSLERITIREFINVPLGTFGEQTIAQYKTFFDDGSYCTHVILKTDDEPYAMLIEEGVSDLKELPLVLYSATDIDPLSSEPPLLNLAQKNKAYYELYSEYRQIMFMLNSPVAVRRGLVTPGQIDFSNLPKVVLGSHVVIDVPTDGSFDFVEPDGKALASDREELSKLEDSMNLDTLNFLSSNSENSNKTATEINIASAQTNATLSGLATLKESMLEQISEKWARYYGQTNKGGSCKVNRDLLNIPLTAQDMATLSNMATNGHMSIITLLETLSEGKRLPKSVTPALEVKRLASQRRLQQKLDQGMEIKGNDKIGKDKTTIADKTKIADTTTK